MRKRQQGVLRGGRLPVRHDQRVRRAEQRRDLVRGHVAGAQRDPVGQPQFGDQIIHFRSIGPEFAGDGEGDLCGGLGQGAEQDVQALVGAHDAEEEQARGGGGLGRGGQRQRDGLGGGVCRGGRRGGRGGGYLGPFGPLIVSWQVGRHGYGPHRRGRGQVAGLGGLGGGVGDHRVRAGEQGAGERDVAGAALVRQHVVADDARCAAVPAGRPAHDREVRGDLERGDVGDDDQVGGPQPAASASQPSGRAQDSPRRVRGKGAPSGTPTVCSPG